MRHLLEAVAQNNPDLANDALFPRDAYVATHRFRRSAEGVGARSSRARSAAPSSARTSARRAWRTRSSSSFELGHSIAQLAPKKRDFKRPLWRVKHSKLTFTIEGKQRHLDIAEMTAWRGAWYVTRLRVTRVGSAQERSVRCGKLVAELLQPRHVPAWRATHLEAAEQRVELGGSGCELLLGDREEERLFLLHVLAREGDERERRVGDGAERRRIPGHPRGCRHLEAKEEPGLLAMLIAEVSDGPDLGIEAGGNERGRSTVSSRSWWYPST